MENNAGVAIVDDDVQVVRTYEWLFKRRHIPLAFVAYNGQDAVDKFRNADKKPGIVIVDYRLPDINGLEVMKCMLAIEPKTRIVFISGDDSISQESLDSGATLFLKKPTSIKKISETIKALTEA